MAMRKRALSRGLVADKWPAEFELRPVQPLLQPWARRAEEEGYFDAGVEWAPWVKQRPCLGHCARQQASFSRCRMASSPSAHRAEPSRQS